MEKVNMIGKLANQILFWLSISVSVHVVMEPIMLALGLIEPSITYRIGLITVASIHWVAYFLHRMQVVEPKYFAHTSAFLWLSLFTFMGLYNPYGLNQIWVVFLLYPILISLFEDKWLFLFWSSCCYIIYALFMILDPHISISHKAGVIEIYNRCSMVLVSFMLACIVFSYISYVRKRYQQVSEDKNREYVITLLHKLIPIVERKSQTTSREIEQMSRLIKRMIKEFPQENVSDWEIKLISLLHFVSRIKWPDYVFEKEEKLTSYEYQIVQEHCFIGWELLHEQPTFERVVKVLRYHHERFDGSGYPYQLKGGSIPILSQIVGIAESYLAMTTSRSYRVALSPEEAYKEITSMAGSAYDEKVVHAFCKAQQMQSQTSGTPKVPPLVG